MNSPPYVPVQVVRRDYLHCSMAQVYAMMSRESDPLPSRLIAGKRMVKLCELTDWMDRQPTDMQVRGRKRQIGGIANAAA